MRICSDKLSLHEHIKSSATKTLKYQLHDFSSYSAIYFPHNVLLDRPCDPSSRWSSDAFNPPQYLVFKLEKLAVVNEIKFGKYEKTHMCNLKKFRVYSGLSEDNMNIVLESGLRNDAAPESFTLSNELEGVYVPVSYIKIEPIQSWGQNFNFSIWYIELLGVDDSNLVNQSLQLYNELREQEMIRLCLKHFREHNYSSAFESLKNHCNVQLEHPLLTKIHDQLVTDGNYTACEEMMEQVSKMGLFNSYVNQQPYQVKWSPIMTDINSSCNIEYMENVMDYSDSGQIVQIHKQLNRPGMRGGHQMCIHPEKQIIYLHGGWDGSRELADFWSYDIRNSQWSCLSQDTSQQDGPTARSCHKMCIDDVRDKIYSIGRYVDASQRTQESAIMKSDMYCYDIREGKWTLLSMDTQSEGGPSLIFDHQLCMDCKNSVIYVFGGRILEARYTSDGEPAVERQPVFSGLYSYNLEKKEWKLLRPDINLLKLSGHTATHADHLASRCIKSRIGHFMLFHPHKRCLYVFGGQRLKEHLTDFFVYDIDNDSIQLLNTASFKHGITQTSSSSSFPGFTQRAVIDIELDEIYALTGMCKDKQRKVTSICNAFWVYDISKDVWACIYDNDPQSSFPSASAVSSSLQTQSPISPVGSSTAQPPSTALSNGEPMLTGCDEDPTSTSLDIPIEPCPRFAHQLVYDYTNKTHYLFGGNPGSVVSPNIRLDDFWSLKLFRPNDEEVLQKCKFQIRRCCFLELASKEKVTALQYLQAQVSEIVNHSDLQQIKEFQHLASALFIDTPVPPHLNVDGVDADFARRTELFDHLVLFFPENMTQPRKSLIDSLTFNMIQDSNSVIEKVNKETIIRKATNIMS